MTEPEAVVTYNGLSTRHRSSGGTAAASVAAWRAAAAPVDAVGADGQAAYVHPTGDLDGDRVADIAVLSYTPPSLTCLSGAGGRVLHVLQLDGLAAVRPADATWRTLIVATAATTKPGPTDPPHDVTLTLSRVDGCVRRWSTPFTGRIYAPGGVVSTELPYFRGLLRNRDGFDLLVERQTVLSPPHSLVRTTTTVLAGSDGSTLVTTPPEDFVDQDPTLVPMPDVSGDGRGDYLTALRHREVGPVLTKPDAVVAHRSDDGAVLWSQEVANDFDTAAKPVGDVTGDGVADIVVGTAVSQLDTSLLDGASGEILWTKPGQAAQIVGGATGRGPLVSLDRVLLGDRATFEVNTYDAAGDRVYRVRRDLGSGEGVGTVTIEADTVGDADLDGFADTAYSVTAAGEGKPVTASWLLSGRTGRTDDVLVHALKPDDNAAGHGSVDGRGDDVWEPRRSGVSIRSGDGLAPVTSVTYAGAVLSLLVTQLDRHACPDLVALVQRGSVRTVVAVSGRTGATVWSVPPLAPAQRPVLSPPLPVCAVPAGPPRARPRPLPATGSGPGAWAVLPLIAAAAAAAARRRLGDRGAAAAQPSVRGG